MSCDESILLKIHVNYHHGYYLSDFIPCKNTDTDVKSTFFTMCLRSLVVRALERYSKDPGSSPGGDTCFSHQ